MKNSIKRGKVFFILLTTLAFFTQCEKEKNESPPLGQLVITPQETLINVNTELSAHINVPPGISISDSILLIKISANGNTTDISYLLDDGNLSSTGDEIKGDGVFSCKFTLNESSQGDIKFKAIAKLAEENREVSSETTVFHVFNDLAPGEMRTVLTVQNTATNKLNEFLNGNVNNAPSAINQLVDWLDSQPDIESIEFDGTSAIEIKYKSGLMGGIIVSLLDEEGYADIRGGFSTEMARNITRPDQTPEIPLHRQTRGISFDNTKSTQAFDAKTIGNRNVFIYAAFEASWKNNERPHIINILDSVSCGDFKVTSYTNQAATIARLYEITSYGTVVFATHGSGGKVILTGEIVDTLSDAYKTYKPMMQGANPKIGISTNMTISKTGTAVTKANVYKVYNTFISALPGTFPQSVILNNSCQSDKTSLLRDAFLAKGAKTYFGYSESVGGRFSVAVSRDVFLTLARDGKKTGEVSRINTTWPSAPNPTFRLRGSADMTYSMDLVNGNFEDGMLGWTKDGDGRIISQLGYLDPTGGNYMGIISTGLGFTTQTGNISQSFKVPANASKLSFKWNFLSEEFLEYIGSSFQDKFQLVLINDETGEEVLMNKTIDIIASEFGASRPSDQYPDGIPGDLIAVSPDITFDRGGVYMTGWQTSEFSLTAYKGKCVTLVLRCTDVGDSIYDTAIILDDIVIN
jgi:hypothetical protein